MTRIQTQAVSNYVQTRHIADCPSPPPAQPHSSIAHRAAHQATQSTRTSHRPADAALKPTRSELNPAPSPSPDALVAVLDVGQRVQPHKVLGQVGGRQEEAAEQAADLQREGQHGHTQVGGAAPGEGGAAGCSGGGYEVNGDAPLGLWPYPAANRGRRGCCVHNVENSRHHPAPGEAGWPLGRCKMHGRRQCAGRLAAHHALTQSARDVADSEQSIMKAVKMKNFEAAAVVGKGWGGQVRARVRL